MDSLNTRVRDDGDDFDVIPARTYGRYDTGSLVYRVRRARCTHRVRRDPLCSPRASPPGLCPSTRPS